MKNKLILMGVGFVLALITSYGLFSWYLGGDIFHLRGELGMKDNCLDSMFQLATQQKQKRSQRTVEIVCGKQQCGLTKYSLAMAGLSKDSTCIWTMLDGREQYQVPTSKSGHVVVLERNGAVDSVFCVDNLTGQLFFGLGADAVEAELSF
jgi:hypothetical protein